MAKSKRKTTAKKRRKKTDGTKRTPVRVRFLVGVLLVAIAAGIGSVKLFETTRGRVMLLDAGFTDYYSQVQEELETELRFALRSLELQFGLEISVEREKIAGQYLLVRRWQTRCEGDCSPARIGLEFTRAAKSRGAKAESSIEPLNEGETAGEVVTIVVGSRRYPTHRIIVHCLEAANREPAAATVPRPKLALVIDDFGYSRSRIVEGFLKIDLPLTISVIPSLPRTRYSIEQAWANDKEAILHVPMEAENGTSDVAFVSTAMTDAEIHELLSGYLDDSPGVIGVNNHQGSLATQDPRVMEAVAAELGRRDLFFFDSLTSHKSVAYNTAKRLNIPTAKNDLFLDAGTESHLVVEDRLLQLLELARRKGTAIGIGHPKPWTYEAIRRNQDVLRESGVELVFLSEVLE